jgi:hypothetical protein
MSFMLDLIVVSENSHCSHPPQAPSLFNKCFRTLQESYCSVNHKGGTIAEGNAMVNRPGTRTEKMGMVWSCTEKMGMA